MLVLSRLRDESIVIGDSILVTVVAIRGDKVRLGVSAPKDISVHRKEVYDAIRREKGENAEATKQQTLFWGYESDLCVWRAYSAIGDGDSSFKYEINVTEDGHFSVYGSERELIPNSVKPFSNLAEAKEFCETEEAGHLLEAK